MKGAGREVVVCKSRSLLETFTILGLMLTVMVWPCFLEKREANPVFTPVDVALIALMAKKVRV